MSTRSLLRSLSLPALLLGAALLSGCEKPEEGLVICDPADAGVNSVPAFHRLFVPPVQVLTADAARSQNVFLLDGSTIFVPAGAFALPSGTAATGNVELRVQMLTKPNEMILGGLPSMSFWRPLEAGGQFRIKAWQNGVPLRLRAGRSLTVNVRQPANSSPVGQMMWSGIGVGPGSLNMTWIQDSARVRLEGIPGGQQFFQTRVWTDTLGWFNISRLWTSNPSDTTQLRADVAGDASTRVYLLPTQRSGAFLMKWNTLTRVMELYGVPVGTPMKVLTLRVQSGQLLMSTEQTTVRRGLVLRPNLQPVTAEQAADVIEGL